MPRVFLSEADRARHRLAMWVQGERHSRKMSQQTLADGRGMHRTAMEYKLKSESFSFDDFVFFARTFGMDYDTFQYIVGTGGPNGKHQ